MRVRGLKLRRHYQRRGFGKSHPMRVRGLKQRYCRCCFVVRTSHPMRVRGLKQAIQASANSLIQVAPHAGAWIETYQRYIFETRIFSRTPCGCVD